MDERNDNKLETLKKLAIIANDFRIFPRLFISIYILMFYETTTWFMALEDPTTQQASLVGAITGIGAAWFGLYVKSGEVKGD